MIHSRRFAPSSRLASSKPPRAARSGAGGSVRAQGIKTTPASTLPEVPTVEELAAYLRRDPKTVYDHLRAGKIPHQSLGRSYVLHRDVILRWLAGEKCKNGELVEAGKGARR